MVKVGIIGDAIICLGCVIQGETRHFDFICDAVANAIAQLAVEENRDTDGKFIHAPSFFVFLVFSAF